MMSTAFNKGRDTHPTRVIATAREAGREAIQKKQRELIKRINAWIAAPSATARNDAERRSC